MLEMKYGFFLGCNKRIKGLFFEVKMYYVLYVFVFSRCRRIRMLFGLGWRIIARVNIYFILIFKLVFLIIKLKIIFFL